MKAAISLIVELDQQHLEDEAAKRGVSTDVVASQIADDLESRGFDAVRWRHGVRVNGVTSHVELVVSPPPVG